VELAATTAEEFLRAAAQRFGGEFFVPWDDPYPGGRVKFEAPFGDTGVRGLTQVRAAVRDGRKGLLVRIVALDPDSLSIPLVPAPSTHRVPTPLPLPAAAPRAIKQDTVPAPGAPLPPLSAARPAPLAPAPRPPSVHEDFEEPAATPTSPLPERVARSMKTPLPPEQANVLRRTPAAGVPVGPWGKTGATSAPPRPATAPPRPATAPPRPPPAAPRPPTAPPVAAPAPAPVVAAPAPAPVEPPPAAPPPRAAERPAARPAGNVLSMSPGQISLASLAQQDGPPRRRRALPRRLVIASAVAVFGVAALAILLVRSGDSAAGDGDREATVARHLDLADARMREGRLTGAGGDQALDHLLAAREAAPADPRVKTRLAALADAFETLADGALAAGDLAEAATHLQAAINAQPDRAATQARLRDVEQRVRDRQGTR
jgi:hypothetical protein